MQHVTRGLTLSRRILVAPRPAAPVRLDSPVTAHGAGLSGQASTILVSGVDGKGKGGTARRYEEHSNPLCPPSREIRHPWVKLGSEIN